MLYYQICSIAFSGDGHSYIRSDLVELFGFRILVRNLNRIWIFKIFGLDLVESLRVRIRFWISILIIFF